VKETFKDKDGKTLKIWNGRGWGFTYDKDPPNTIEYLRKHPDHVYVCAHSVKEAIEICNKCAGYRVLTVSEISNYWHKGCWGNAMEGVVPEVGVWATKHSSSQKAERIYP
jgi:hypothetical protein